MHDDHKVAWREKRKRKLHLLYFLNQNNLINKDKIVKKYNKEAIKHETHDEPGRIMPIKKRIHINHWKTDDYNVVL